MNRFAFVFAISLAVSMGSVASAAAGPNGELQRSARAGQHGPPASTPASGRKPKTNAPASAAPAQPPAVSTRPASTPPTAPKHTGRGANVSGPYDPSGVGLPSQNGKGSGGQGRPCAGCVGRADGKNPPGQLPGRGDHNAGYECDRNEGMGKTNPPHSGCSEQSSEGPLTSPAAEVVAIAAALELATSGRTAAPVSSVAGDPGAKVLGTQESGGPAGAGPDSDANSPSAADRSAGKAALPFTGLAVGLLVLLGVALAGSGVLLNRMSRIAPSGG